MSPTPRRDAAGQRDRLIAIEQSIETQDPSGFPIQDWTTLAPRVWAAYDDESGGETFTATQVLGTAQVRWTIPYRADCDPEVLDVVKLRRIVAHGRLYDIVRAAQIGYRRGLELTTRAHVG